MCSLVIFHLPLLLSCCGFFLVFGCRISFLVEYLFWSQSFFVKGSSGVSCDFAVFKRGKKKLVALSCPSLCYSMDCSPPGSCFLRGGGLCPSIPWPYLQLMHILQISILPTDHLPPSHITVTIYVLCSSLYIQLLLSIEGSGLVPLALENFSSSP